MVLIRVISAPFLEQIMQKNPEPVSPGGGVMDGAGAVCLSGSYSYSSVKYAIFTGTYDYLNFDCNLIF